jgi:NadR type nicotinamide-nucleotide adenylyltransferase
VKKVIVIGPECTGKSTLCEKLAEHYKTAWCPEFAREYLKQHGNQYSYDDLLNISMGQLELEDVMLSEARNGLYFIDTDMYVMKVWCEEVFESCHPWILKQIAQREYDLYLLCKTDIPWVSDGLREYPDQKQRERLYKVYKDLMINTHTRWVEVSGSHSDRLQTAITVIDSLKKTMR